MATGMSVARANAAIDAAVALGTWIQLHIADPGAAGTAGVAVHAERKQASFAGAVGGSAVTNADLEYADVDASEDYTHWTMWSSEVAGTFLWSGEMTANAVTTGDTFKIAAGGLTLAVTGAAD